MKKQLENIYRDVLIQGLAFIENYLEEARKKEYWWDIKNYNEYPRLSFFESGLPSFSSSSSEKVDYSAILHKDSKCEQIESWKKYYNFVCSSDKLKEFYGKGFFEKNTDDEYDGVWPKIYTYYTLSGFIDRYIHLNSEKTKFNEELFINQFNKWYNSINEKKLVVEIYVPILLTTFDFEEVKLSDNILIKKMEDKFQLSRHEKISFTDSSKDTVAGAATHSLVLKNWSVDNLNYNTREMILEKIKSYSEIIEIIESFFSAFRVKTGLYSGFSQIVAKAIDWEDGTKGDLYHVKVTSIRKYPDFFDNYGWLNKPPLIKKEDVLRIADFFVKTRDTKHKRIKLALSRLNTSFLRSREEDTILDITIALETLLTHDSQSEITYRLSSRVAALCMIKPFKDFNQYQVFNFCKKIYAYRSAVVHGDSKKIVKTKTILIKEEKEIETILISLELLRHILDILIDKPEFNNPAEIDKLKFKCTEPN